jgi:hypothetical protein
MEVFDLSRESVIEAQCHRFAESWATFGAEQEPLILGARKKRGQMEAALKMQATDAAESCALIMAAQYPRSI